MHQQHRSPVLHAFTSRLAPISAALTLAGVAQAQVLPLSPALRAEETRSPYYVGASQAFSYSSNVFRAPDGQDVDDTISTTSLLAGINQPFGRQRLQADAAVRYNKYRDQDQLDNTAYRLGALFDWETIERLSGTVSLTAQQNLARYGTESTVPTTDRNVEKANEFGATIQYGGQSILALYGLYQHRSIDYSHPSFALSEYDRDLIGAGLRYRVSGALQLGGELRAAKGEYPNGRGGLGDEFDRREIAGTVLWVPTGASTLRARLAATDQEHQEEARDFSGFTGSLNWEWQPTGKLRFETELRRDTGQEGTPLLLAGAVTAVGDNDEVSNRLLIRATYDATAKIALDAFVRYTHRKLIDTVTIPGVAFSNAGTDNTTTLLLGIRYQPTRTIQLGCGLGYEDRSADSSVSYSYSLNSATCFAQIVLSPF